MSPHKKSYNSKKKANKTLFIAIAIIAIIIVGIAAYAVLGQGIQTTNSITITTPAPSISSSTSTSPTPSPTTTQILLQTTAGNITLELRSDKPITTTNFVNLVNKGVYDGTTFHRVIAGFMIQGGENDSANVATIPDEIGTNNRNVAYTIAMAKTSAPNSATSQFFINVVDNGNMVVDSQGTKFDAVYTVFGNVIAGQSVVYAIANAPVTSNAYEQNSTPINPVTVIKATVLP
jgi:cyclophilin family peptidyl-prolyl cis-trans isomerase